MSISVGQTNEYCLSSDFEIHELYDTVHISSLGFTAKGYATLTNEEGSTLKVHLNPFKLVLPQG